MSNPTRNIIAIGNGLMGKLKYGFRFNYDPFEFFMETFSEKKSLKHKISKSIYKKIR